MMTHVTKILAAALLALVPVTSIAAAEPGAGSSGMLGNHPAVIAHLLAMPAMPAIPASTPARVELGVHPAVVAYLLMRGGVVNQSAAPQVKTAFRHVDRTHVQTAALGKN